MGHKKFVTWYKIEIFCTHTNKNVIYAQKKIQNFLGSESIFYYFPKSEILENYIKKTVRDF
jgi:hypothetical protein